MIVAPYVFEIDEDGHYTTDVAVDWVRTDGTPTVLAPGRLLRYTDEGEWQVTTAKSLRADATWKPIAKAAKAVKEGFEQAEIPTDPQAGYYELLDPDAASEPFALTPPRTSLYALQKWVPAQEAAGILWRWEPENSTERYFAVVRAELLNG